MTDKSWWFCRNFSIWSLFHDYRGSTFKDRLYSWYCVSKSAFWAIHHGPLLLLVIFFYIRVPYQWWCKEEGGSLRKRMGRCGWVVYLKGGNQCLKESKYWPEGDNKKGQNVGNPSELMELGSKYGRISRTCSRELQGQQFPQGEQGDGAPFREEVEKGAEDKGSFSYRVRKMWVGSLQRKLRRRASFGRKSSAVMKISWTSPLWHRPDVFQDYETFTTTSGPRGLLCSWSENLHPPLHRQHETPAPMTHDENLKIGSSFRPEGMS